MIVRVISCLVNDRVVSCSSCESSFCLLRFVIVCVVLTFMIDRVLSGFRIVCVLSGFMIVRVVSGDCTCYLGFFHGILL